MYTILLTQSYLVESSLLLWGGLAIRNVQNLVIERQNAHGIHNMVKPLGLSRGRNYFSKKNVKKILVKNVGNFKYAGSQKYCFH